MDQIDIQKRPNYPMRFATGCVLLFLLTTMTLPIWNVTFVGHREIRTDRGSFWSLLDTLWSNFTAPEIGVKQPLELLSCHAHNLILAPLVLLVAVALWYFTYRAAHLWLHTYRD